MKIVVLDGYTENPGDLTWEPLAALGDLEVHDRSRQEDVAEVIGDAEIAIVNKLDITKEIIDACPNLRYIGVLVLGPDGKPEERYLVDTEQLEADASSAAAARRKAWRYLMTMMLSRA